jgi:hypothetical protein
VYGKYFYGLKTKTMTEKEAFNDPEMKTIIMLSGYARELGEGKNFEETTYKTAETIVKIFSIHNVSKRISLTWRLVALFGIGYMLADLIRYVC